MGGLSNDWLSQLAPAHAPPPIGWWPPAPGWWAVAVLVVAVSAGVVYFLMRPAARLRRLALRELDRLERTALDDGRFAAETEHVLRRYAVSAYGRETVAGLSGRAWLEFLASHGGMGLSETGAAMLSVAYGGQVAIDRTRLLSGARKFVRSKP